MSWNRRDFLKGLGGSGLALSVRAAAIGVPVNFLLTGSVQASEIIPKTVVMAISSRGEAFNCNAPGSYGNLSDGDDIKNNIVHPSAGNGVTGTIAGETVDASYFAADTSVMISMGEQQVRAPQAYQLLPQDFLDSMALVYHRTGTNAHPEFGSVLELMGALKSQAGNGSEQLPTAIAEEISLPEFRNSLFDLPMPVSNQKITAAGKPINRYSPTGMKQIISSGGSFVASYSDFDAIYKSTIDHIYKELKESGSSAQLRFLDQHAKSRADAQLLGDQLGDLLTDINDNSVESEFKVACALASLNISSVVTVLNEYSGDNHGDTNLVDETVQTIRTLNTLNTYWDLVKSYGLEDRMLFTTLNVFGRTAGTNDRGGRDHDGSFTVGMIQGAGVNGGVYGDLVAGTRNKKPVEVSGISLANGDQILANETLSAYGKTIMTLAGCSEARVNARIPTSQVISDIIAT